MKLIDQSTATNWNFVLLVVILGIFAGGGILWYSFFMSTGLEKQIEFSIKHVPKVEKVVYTKATSNQNIGRVRSLRVAHIDGTARRLLIDNIPNDPLNDPRFLLIPERNEVLLIVQGRNFPYEIQLEKIELETGNRIKLGSYQQGKYGAALGDVLLSPDKRKIAFTSYRTLLVADSKKPAGGAITPFYTLEEGHEGGRLGIESWDSGGNIYLKVLNEYNLTTQGFIKVTPQGQGIEVEEIKGRILEVGEPPLHAIEITGKGPRDIAGAELYIDGILFDSIGEISVTYGHGPAFEVLGFVKGRVLEGWERDEQETKEAEIRRFKQTAFYPTYIPKGWIKESESASAPAALTTRFARGESTFTILQRKIETSYLVETVPILKYPSSQYPIEAISSLENVFINGNSGLHLVTYNTQQQLLWDTDQFRIIIYCFERDGCNFSKDELIKIAESMEPVWSLGKTELPTSPEPIPAPSPTPESPVPALPIIRLEYQGQIYEGEQGSYCWSSLCVDTFLPDPASIISVAKGDVLAIQIEVHEDPLSLEALIVTSLSDPEPKAIILNPSLTSELLVSVLPGKYIIFIGGSWNEGDIFYSFKIDVK